MKLPKCLRCFRYAFEGIGTLMRTQRNARIHCAVMAAVIAAGLFFSITALEWCAVIICIGGVLMAESLNSAVEFVCDKACPERDPLIKHAKDLGAAAVLIFTFAAIAVGLIIFLPKISTLIADFF